ncbi:hypothetical protein Cni_G10912 [Canna indica]|uniref:RING-type E3 ubiquitin transferase (cysteine targeting) n=1 Tax=Canna indica TaxID=4628 RepID=A0AAQ3K519_9LILI|nr:hypothetical protein Cni_G10912 [Canna indica]
MSGSRWRNGRKISCKIRKLVLHMNGMRVRFGCDAINYECADGGIERFTLWIEIRENPGSPKYYERQFSEPPTRLRSRNEDKAAAFMPFDRETLVPSSRSASSSSPSSRGSDPPPENSWVEECRRSYLRWKSLRDSSQLPIQVATSRVNQFDAARLDVEMFAMLKEQLVKVFSLMKPGFLFQYEPELDAFLEFLIWRFSIWVDKPTPGNALMNLRYRDERSVPSGGKEVRTGLEGPGLSASQKIWYCLTIVGGQYIWSRVQTFSAFRRWGNSEQRSLARGAWLLLQRLEGIYKVASYGNLLVFLYTGRYRSIIERILKARLVYGSPNMNRAVSFEYMNRQLVWNEFSEMLLLLLPLLNSSLLKRFLLPFSKDKPSGSSGDEAVCPICQSNPTILFMALPCQHRYCYYCLRTRCTAVSSYRCARCNESVIAIQRYGSSETSTSILGDSSRSSN